MEQPICCVVDQVIAPDAPRALFLTGSLPLGMATNGSDLDFVVVERCYLTQVPEAQTLTSIWCFPARPIRFAQGFS
jgi:hypothetical protein